MNAVTILETIASHGGEVRIVDGRPRVRAPRPIPAEIVAEAREHRAEIVAILTARSPLTASSSSTVTTSDGCTAHSVSAADVLRAWQRVEQIIAATPADDHDAQWSVLAYCPCCAGPSRATELTCRHCRDAVLAELVRTPPCVNCVQVGYTFMPGTGWQCEECYRKGRK